MESPTCSSSTVHTELLPSTKRVTLQLGAKQATPPRILLTVHPSPHKPRLGHDFGCRLRPLRAFLGSSCHLRYACSRSVLAHLSSKMLCRLSKQILGSIVCCQHSPHACCQCDNAATTFHGTAMFSRPCSCPCAARHLLLLQHATFAQRKLHPSLAQEGSVQQEPALLKQGVRGTAAARMPEAGLAAKAKLFEDSIQAPMHIATKVASPFAM